MAISRGSLSLSSFHGSTTQPLPETPIQFLPPKKTYTPPCPYHCFYSLQKFRVTDERRWNAKGKLITESEATVKIHINNEERITVGIGNGPVNAIDSALRKALISFYPSLEKLKLTDYKVMIISPEKGTGAITRVFIESTDDSNKHWTTIGVSSNIIDASYDAIFDFISLCLVC